MRNTLMIRNSVQFEIYAKQLLVKRNLAKFFTGGKKSAAGQDDNMFDRRSDCSEVVTAEERLLKNEYLIAHRRPKPRDGHTAAVYVSEAFGTTKPYMVVFGGDRYKQPFNDVFLLDLENEFFSKTKSNLI
jgi:hypothetical protein